MDTIEIEKTSTSDMDKGKSRKKTAATVGAAGVAITAGFASGVAVGKYDDDNPSPSSEQMISGSISSASDVVDNVVDEVEELTDAVITEVNPDDVMIDEPELVETSAEVAPSSSDVYVVENETEYHPFASNDEIEIDEITEDGNIEENLLASTDTSSAVDLQTDLMA